MMYDPIYCPEVSNGEHGELQVNTLVNKSEHVEDKKTSEYALGCNYYCMQKIFEVRF